MDKRQYKMLKRLCDRNDDTYIPESDPVISFLISYGYVKAKDPYYIVTEEGKAAMSDYLVEKTIPWLSFFLSIVAIVIAVLK